jgi:hypothetical protein
MSVSARVLPFARRHARRAAARALVVLPALLLPGCGGGIFVGFDSGFDDFPPSVSIASVASVQAGQPVQLVAAAADESGIDSVAFFRLDGSDAVLLGSDGSEPYEWTTTAPTDGRTTLRVFARARDNAGNRADSDVLSIAVTP